MKKVDPCWLKWSKGKDSYIQWFPFGCHQRTRHSNTRTVIQACWRTTHSMLYCWMIIMVCHTVINISASTNNRAPAITSFVNIDLTLGPAMAPSWTCNLFTHLEAYASRNFRDGVYAYLSLFTCWQCGYILLCHQIWNITEIYIYVV